MADSTNLQASAYSAQGTPRDAVALPGDVFDGTVNMPVMHLAVKAFLANQRQGTHATKTRRWVVGGNQKPWKQKGTGRARQGSTRAPNWPGGGTVFGPQPRGYEQKVPRQIKALARKSALNARARENAVLVIDRFAYEAPKTSQLVQLLARLERIGYRASLALDAAQALEAAARGHYDLVLVDNEARELADPETIRRLSGREHQGGHVPVVVIVSPAASGDQRQAYRAAGADECFNGLVDIEALNRTQHG